MRDPLVASAQEVVSASTDPTPVATSQRSNWAERPEAFAVLTFDDRAALDPVAALTPNAVRHARELLN